MVLYTEKMFQMDAIILTESSTHGNKVPNIWETLAQQGIYRYNFFQNRRNIISEHRNRRRGESYEQRPASAAGELP